MQKFFHQCLQRLANKGLLTVVHNNIADMRYFQRHVDLPEGTQYYIPSLCRYIRSSYNPRWPSILLDDRQGVLESYGPHHYPYPLHKKASPFEWHELYEHQAILLVPTEVSFMTFFEYLQATIPMIIPSMSLLQSWVRTGRLTMGTLRDYGMEQEENLMVHWIPFADYYHDAEIQHAMIYFDSMEDLHQTLHHPALADILDQKHRVLTECRRRRTNAILSAWTEVVHHDYFHFICYNFWPCLADFHLDVDYTKEPECTPFYRYTPIQPNHMFNNALIFVKMDLLSVFLHQIRPNIRTPFRLLLGVSDMSPTNIHIDLLIQDELCKEVYATNTVHEHPKITHLPIGFPEPRRQNGDCVFLRSRFYRSFQQDKTIDLFVRPFGTTTLVRLSKMERLSEIYGIERRFETIVKWTEKVPWKELHEYLGKSKFALCLRGNGLDTHYFYECILNECVPLVWHEPEVPRFPLYDSFPCIQFVDPRELEAIDFKRMYETIDWKNAKQKLLRRHYKYLKSC